MSNICVQKKSINELQVCLNTRLYPNIHWRTVKAALTNSIPIKGSKKKSENSGYSKNRTHLLNLCTLRH